MNQQGGSKCYKREIGWTDYEKWESEEENWNIKVKGNLLLQSSYEDLERPSPLCKRWLNFDVRIV